MVDRAAEHASLAVLAILLVALSGCDSLVGVECAPGYVRCDRQCLRSCEQLGDAGTPDGDGGVTPDSGPSVVRDAGADAAPIMLADGGAVVATGDAATSPACTIGQLACSVGCVDALVDPNHCGHCDTACGSGEVCAAGVCQTSCPAPLVLCDGRCIDVSSDPMNCGSCGDVCTDTGLCIDGGCASGLAGHVVLVGHDFTATHTAQDRLAGNALFLARGASVRTLVFDGTVTDASRTGVESALDRMAAAMGRAWTPLHVTDASKVPLQLAIADALVIHAQASGTDAELLAIGAAWAPALRAFLARGGVVVLFDSLSTSHAGTWQILEGAGLFAATSMDDATGALVTIAAPADAVAVRVPLRYVGAETSVHYDTSDGVVVTRDDTGAVVVHETVLP